jgi:hypothetical protein
LLELQQFLLRQISLIVHGGAAEFGLSQMSIELCQRLTEQRKELVAARDMDECSSCVQTLSVLIIVCTGTECGKLGTPVVTVAQLREAAIDKRQMAIQRLSERQIALRVWLNCVWQPSQPQQILRTSSTGGRDCQ